MVAALSLTEEDGTDPTRVEAVLTEIAAEFSPDGRHGFELARLAGGWAFRTDARCHAVVSRLFELPDDAAKLTPAAIECLAIIAYLQPISRPQIAEVRGVNSDSTVRTLLERELITEVGRSSAAGGAILYGTTPRFEAVFGLAGLDDLPALEGFALTEDQKEDLRRRLGLLNVPE
jgi:segregation and condensation protein B